MTLAPADAAILARRVQPMVDAGLVAEHESAPFGPHSTALSEVLLFLRRNPDPDLPRYVVLRRGEPPVWQIACRGPKPGSPVDLLGDGLFTARAAAEHAVFLRRLDDYGLRP